LLFSLGYGGAFFMPGPKRQVGLVRPWAFGPRFLRAPKMFWIKKNFRKAFFRLSKQWNSCSQRKKLGHFWSKTVSTEAARAGVKFDSIALNQTTKPSWTFLSRQTVVNCSDRLTKYLVLSMLLIKTNESRLFFELLLTTFDAIIIFMAAGSCKNCLEPKTKTTTIGKFNQIM